MNNELPWVISIQELHKLLHDSAAHKNQRNARREAFRQKSEWVERALAHPDDLSVSERRLLEQYLREEEENKDLYRSQPLALCPVVVADVRWYLDGRSGYDAYKEGHIPHSVFIDLDSMLAGPASKEEGRHPLPLEESFAAAMEVSGIADDTTVVAYDDAGGASASRLVWLLRASGHRAAVLDGGLNAWIEYCEQTHKSDEAEQGIGQLHDHFLDYGDDVTEAEEAGAFTVEPFNTEWIVSIDEAATFAGEGVVIDARAPERYRGDNEPMDSRAGHIPGALNLFHGDLIDDKGYFLDPDQVVSRLNDAGVETREGQSLAESLVVYCGSGVTATHEIVALAHAGIQTRLYPGSWSQYSATDRPIAQGTER